MTQAARSLFSRVYAALANTRLGRFLSVNVVWKVDPYLMRAIRGRLGMGLVMPTALLEPEVRRATWSDATWSSTSTTATGLAERKRLWALAELVFAPYAAYRREAAKAGRAIPIVQLAPRQ